MVSFHQFFFLAGTLHAFLSSMCATCSTRLIQLGLVTQIISGEEWTLRSFSIRMTCSLVLLSLSDRYASAVRWQSISAFAYLAVGWYAGVEIGVIILTGDIEWKSLKCALWSDPKSQQGLCGEKPLVTIPKWYVWVCYLSVDAEWCGVRSWFDRRNDIEWYLCDDVC